MCTDIVERDTNDFFRCSIVIWRAVTDPRVGENVLRDWAKIVDCGDAPLTFLVL